MKSSNVLFANIFFFLSFGVVLKFIIINSIIEQLDIKKCVDNSHLVNEIAHHMACHIDAHINKCKVLRKR